nr:L10-interacting MYB domain-containing protein-like [Tanacetum cinerariifolium]
MAVNLTSGALTKISTGACTEKDLKPVVQVTYINSLTRSINGKPWYLVVLFDGSFMEFGYIPYEIYMSKKLPKGSIVQLTKFQVTKVFDTDGAILSKGGILGFDLTVIHSKCDIIVESKRYPLNETNLDVGTAPTIPDEIHVDSDLNEDIDDSHNREETPTSKQNPSTSTQKCFSHSSTQNENFNQAMMTSRDLQKKMALERAIKSWGHLKKTLEEGVSKMMMEKNKEVDVGLKKLETLEEDVSILTRMMMEKNKEDDIGACIEKLEKMGWGAQEPMYDTSLLLFSQSANYRRLWLHMKPESCRN